MKFSNEAMRDTLLFLEENIKYETYGTFDDKRKTTYNISMIVENEYFFNLFSKHKYTKDELRYTIEKMIDGHILNSTGSLDTHCRITDISFYWKIVNTSKILTCNPYIVYCKVKEISIKISLLKVYKHKSVL